MKIELFTKKIHLKNVELGDHVLSLNNDGEVIYGEVTDLFRPTVAKANQVTVTTGSASLTTSLDHPLLTYDKDTTRMVYREVKDLAVGDPLITIGADSEILLTPIISIEAATTEDETFYDMTVEPDNCYFAGVHPDHLVVSHNSVTTYYPIWHLEVENLLVLKNNKGTQDTRVRRLDYGAQWNAYLIRRALRKQDITLFSPHEVPDLYEAFFSRDPAEFERLYEKYESSTKIKYKKSVPGRPLLETFLIERQETGRIYPFFADNVNTHSPFLDPVYLSNLCAEITLSTKPIENVISVDEETGKGSVDFNGLVQLCTLAAVNLGNLNVNEPNDMKRRTRLLVRFLNELLDYQQYQAPQAKNATMTYRPLGIGVVNYAYFLAKNGLKYYDQGSHDLTHRVAEQLYYYALEASVDLAAERGPIPGLHRTIYADGRLMIDSYNKNVDSITAEPMALDWDALREKVRLHGVHNATLLALMPAESSSFVSNSTNGIEPIRSLVVKKANKKSKFVQVVPEASRLKNEYTYLWDMTASQFDGYLKNAAVWQKFVCQSISTNTSYNPEHYPEKRIPLEVLINHFLMAAKFGLKTLYYSNTKGEKDNTENLNEPSGELAVADGEDEGGEGGCAGGACSI